MSFVMYQRKKKYGRGNPSPFPTVNIWIGEKQAIFRFNFMAKEIFIKNSKAVLYFFNGETKQIGFKFVEKSEKNSYALTRISKRTHQVSCIATCFLKEFGLEKSIRNLPCRSFLLKRSNEKEDIIVAGPYPIFATGFLKK